MHTFRLGPFGRSFATRGRGSELREQLLSETIDEDVEIDFTGVEHVSSSFADEFLGRLTTDHRDIRVSLLGLGSDVERVVTTVLERRRRIAPACR